MPFSDPSRRRRRRKPPQRREVCGFSIYYKGALVREYYGKNLLAEFEKTASEKGIVRYE